MIKVLLFDIDGTLVSTGGAGARAFARTAASLFGLEDGTRGLEFAGRTDLAIVRELFERHGISPTRTHFDLFFSGYVHWLESFLLESRGEVCPGIGGLMIDLQQSSGHQRPLCGLLTGNIRLGAEIKLRHHQLWDFFEMGAYGSDHEDRDQLARTAMERAAAMRGEPVRGSEVLVIGDTPRDIACARSIGAHCLAVATGKYPIEALRECAPGLARRHLDGVTARELMAIGS